MRILGTGLHVPTMYATMGMLMLCAIPLLHAPQEHKVRAKMVEALLAEFSDLDITLSVGGQISFDLFPTVREGSCVPLVHTQHMIHRPCPVPVCASAAMARWDERAVHR
jgi:Eukaryotic phosphomannomutase